MKIPMNNGVERFFFIRRKRKSQIYFGLYSHTVNSIGGLLHALLILLITLILKENFETDVN